MSADEEIDPDRCYVCFHSFSDDTSKHREGAAAQGGYTSTVLTMEMLTLRSVYFVHYAKKFVHCIC